MSDVSVTIQRAIALHLTLTENFFEEFRKIKESSTPIEYTDILIKWNDVEYKFTMEDFASRLGLELLPRLAP